METGKWVTSTIVQFDEDARITPTQLSLSDDGSHIIFTDVYHHDIRSYPLDVPDLPCQVQLEKSTWMSRPKLVSDAMLVRKLSFGMSSHAVKTHLVHLDENARVAQIGFQLSNGLSPLHFASGVSKSADPELVELMIESGAEWCTDNMQRRPIHYACG